MACGSCSRRRPASRTYDVMGGYKNLPDTQIRARLEIFKKRHCTDCSDRYNCDYVNYSKCSKKII